MSVLAALVLEDVLLKILGELRGGKRVSPTACETGWKSLQE
jgi:hypothetical protein